MRRVSYVIGPERGYLDPGEEVFREYGVVPTTIHDIDRLSDGSLLMRYGMCGDRDRLRECLEQSGGKVVDYRIADADGTLQLQINYHPSDLVEDLLALHREYAVLMEFPLEFVDPETSTLRVVEVGPEDDLGELVSSTADVVDLTVESVEHYRPISERPYARLTERQQEVLRAAVAAGYYELPRRTSYEEIAATLDCSASAVGQHLRRIEARLVDAAVPECEVPTPRG